MGRGLFPKLGHPLRVAFFFEQAQYKISKMKLSISMIAVTPAKESIKASRASW
jgi:hypothetical protein